MPVCGTCGARRPTTHIRSQRACLSSGGQLRHLASARLTCRPYAVSHCHVGVRTEQSRVTWGKAPPLGDDLSLTYLFASTSEKVTFM